VRDVDERTEERRGRGEVRDGPLEK